MKIATTIGIKNVITGNLFEELLDHPQKFDFFQAIRLLEHYYTNNKLSSSFSIPYEDTFSSQKIKFSTHACLHFCPNEIEAIIPDGISEEKKLNVLINFMGLIGSNGILPTHYTESLIQSLRKKNVILLDFLDIFQNRTISLFYHAWAKYRSYISFERSQLLNYSDPHRQFIRSLIGIFPAKNSSSVEHVLLHNAGHYSRQPCSAISLQQILSDYFEIPVKILQFHGEWLNLDMTDATIMPSIDYPQGLNNCLGVNMVVGTRIWHCQNKFRIQLGPISAKRMYDFLPDSGDSLAKLHAIVRQFVDITLNFDIQLILDKESVPCWQLSSKNRFKLGWDTWLSMCERKKDVEDLVLGEKWISSVR